jgi:hypothetical protein
MTFHSLARVGVIGLLAAGALTAAASPALAADVDFGVGFTGTTIALGAPAKAASVDLANLGTSKPAQVRVIFDLGRLDDRIRFAQRDCTAAGRVYTCVVAPESVPAPGSTARLPVALEVTGTPPRGAQGRVTVTVQVEGDAATANDSTSAEVVLAAEGGVDLRVVAFDVDRPGESTEPIEPGGSGATWGVIVNQGDVDATGLRLDIKLPPGLTFASADQGCTYNEARTESSCSLGAEVLVPAWTSNDEPTGTRAIEPEFAVKLAPDAKGPATVGGGTWTVSGRPDEVSSAARSAAKLPSWATAITGTELADLDVDPSDNSDTFAALVAGPGTGSGNGNGDGTGKGAGGGTGGGGPTLPITGPVAGPAAGTGLAFVAAGVLLVLAARRRRAEGVG